jgi:hypothetical protein
MHGKVVKGVKDLVNPMGKEVKEMKGSIGKEWLLLVGALLFMMHMFVIMDDVQAVINDPNTDNKPAEVVKLVIDLSRYWSK